MVTGSARIARSRASDVPPSMVPLPMLDLELSVVPEVGAF